MTYTKSQIREMVEEVLNARKKQHEEARRIVLDLSPQLDEDLAAQGLDLLNAQAEELAHLRTRFTDKLNSLED